MISQAAKRLLSRALPPIFTLLLVLISSVSYGYTSVELSKKGSLIEVPDFSLSSNSKLVLWLDGNQITQGLNRNLLSADDGENRIAIGNQAISFFLAGKNTKPQTFSLSNALNFQSTRYLELHFNSKSITLSDGRQQQKLSLATTLTGASFDRLLESDNASQPLGLIGAAYIDFNNVDKSFTLAFSSDGLIRAIPKDAEDEAEIKGASRLTQTPNIPVPDLSYASEDVFVSKIEAKFGLPPTKTLHLTQNPAHTFAWEGYYWLRTYLNLYKATKNKKYLQWSFDYINTVMAYADDRYFPDQGIESNPYVRAPKPYLTDRSLFAPGWHNRKDNRVYLLIDGMILNGVLRVVDLVKTEQLKEFDAAANTLLERSNRVIESHQSSWSVDKNPDIAGSWYYVNHKNLQLGNQGLFSNPVSYNHSLTMANAMIYYDKWSPDKRYTHVIKSLIRFFDSQLTQHPDGTCTWNYAWYYNQPGRSEDINHGHIDVGFFITAFREGYLEEDAILRCMAKTVVNNIAIGPGVIAGFVDGTGISSKSEMFAVSYDYRELAQFEPSITARSDNLLHQFAELHWFRQFSAYSEALLTTK